MESDSSIDGRLLSALDAAGVPVALVDESERVVFLSGAAERAWGVDRGAHLGLDAAQVPGLATGQQDGGRHVSASMAPRRFSMIAACAPQGVRTETADLPDEQLLEALGHVNRPIAVFNEWREIVHVNRAFTELLGYAFEEVKGRNPVDFFPSPDFSADKLQAYRDLPWGKEALQAEAQLRCKNGRDLWVRISSTPLGRVGDARLTGYSVDVVFDITEDRQIRQLEYDVLQALASSMSFTALGDFPPTQPTGDGGLCRAPDGLLPGGREHRRVCRHGRYVDRAGVDRMLRRWFGAGMGCDTQRFLASLSGSIAHAGADPLCGCL